MKEEVLQQEESKALVWEAVSVGNCDGCLVELDPTLGRGSVVSSAHDKVDGVDRLRAPEPSTRTEEVAPLKPVPIRENNSRRAIVSRKSRKSLF